MIDWSPWHVTPAPHGRRLPVQPCERLGSSGPADHFGGSVEPMTPGDKARFMAVSGGLGAAVGSLGLPYAGFLLSAGDVTSLAAGAAVGTFAGAIWGITLAVGALRNDAAQARQAAQAAAVDPAPGPTAPQ